MDLRQLLKRFDHLPIETIDEAADGGEPYPQALRLILSSHCGQHCQYPDERVLWCHNEGVARDALKPADATRILKVVRFFYDRHKIRRLKLGGLEPILNQRLLDLLTAVRGIGIEDISFTTHARGVNGHLEALRQAGLTRLTVSIQSFDRRRNISLTGRDGLDAQLDLVREAREVGLTPIKINRVLLRGWADDLPSFIGWLRTEGLTARLFDLMWQPGHDQLYDKYSVAWHDFLPLWESEVEKLVIRRYQTAWRTRLLFGLRGGGGLEVNLMQSKAQSATPVCRSCEFANVCAEGYLGCGVRITPDLRLSPCILRPELGLSLEPLVNGSGAEIHAAVDAVLTGVRSA